MVGLRRTTFQWMAIWSEQRETDAVRWRRDDNQDVAAFVSALHEPMYFGNLVEGVATVDDGSHASGFEQGSDRP